MGLPNAWHVAQQCGKQAWNCKNVVCHVNKPMDRRSPVSLVHLKRWSDVGVHWQHVPLYSIREKAAVSVYEVEGCCTAMHPKSVCTHESTEALHYSSLTSRGLSQVSASKPCWLTSSGLRMRTPIGSLMC